MSHIDVINNPTQSEIAGAYGARWGDPAFDERYSNLTPDDIRECVHRCTEGTWRPFHVYGGPILLAAHHLYHIDAEKGTAWCSGMVMKAGRGHTPKQAFLRQALWAAMYYECQSQRLARIFCYALATNTFGHIWIKHGCGFTEVGDMDGAVPEGDGTADIVVYSQHAEDREECRAQAERLFPDGVWAEIP